MALPEAFDALFPQGRGASCLVPPAGGSVVGPGDSGGANAAAVNWRVFAGEGPAPGSKLDLAFSSLGCSSSTVGGGGGGVGGRPAGWMVESKPGTHRRLQPLACPAARGRVTAPRRRRAPKGRRRHRSGCSAACRFVQRWPMGGWKGFSWPGLHVVRLRHAGGRTLALQGAGGSRCAAEDLYAITGYRS
jgi:hypothetical protein